MNLEIIITLIIGFIGSSALAVFVTKYFEKGKTKAETQTINISGELKIGEAWEKYALQQQKDVSDLRKRIEVLEDIVIKSNDKINLLEEENRTLRYQLKKYQVENDIKVETAKEEIKTAVDIKLEEIKK